ncbi:MAG: NAD(P)-dependent oxidoreductase [Terriglobia bacterium]
MPRPIDTPPPRVDNGFPGTETKSTKGANQRMEAYYDSDASLEVLHHQTLGIIGYGNQGRAQALNLRDSGLGVMIGGLRDETAGQAEKDGFAVRSVREVAERADVLALLIPDEVQRQVYDDVLSARLRAGQTLDFAHGYNIRFGLIAPPPDVDVIMVAPRMIGTMVREAFVGGHGRARFRRRGAGRLGSRARYGAGLGAGHRGHAPGSLQDDVCPGNRTRSVPGAGAVAPPLPEHDDGV